MIRSNSFALLIGDGAEKELATKISKVERYCLRIDVAPFKDFGTTLGLGSEAAIAIFLTEDGPTLPIVHGFVGGGGEDQKGEFSLLRAERTGYVAERDPLGTRQLYVKRGKLTGVASDFRFFDSGLQDLVPPSGKCSLPKGEVTRHRLDIPEGEESFEMAARRLADIFSRSTYNRVKRFKKVGVAFSGGLDSSLLAHCSSKESEVMLCSIHAKGSKDEGWSERAADILGMELVSRSVDETELKKELERISLPFQPTPMDRALWCMFSMTGRLARENGAEVLLLGQLADELFGGYRRYGLELQNKGARAATELMEGDVWACSNRGFIRDETACSRWIEPMFPFADEEVVKFALGTPIDYKIAGGQNKMVLREAALELGLPDELARLPKRAAQYSSGILKLV